ncbi:MAG: hypothetical protein EA358_03590 [Flavobacteriales bacterium]|nr:MAG: hypothetical protein EA358_03590 [Flavobacteriales bacterium]
MYMWLRRSVEVAWLFVIAVCVYEVAQNAFAGNNLKAIIFAGIGVLAFVMFRVRRSQRKKIEKKNAS